ncbi:MAG: hypothetical protein D3910_18225, partial [Candidatus Electrothrix sp. ATG2]|nr:hypothetical protein [Candidatus Electrothrix sp. ATG2]
MNNKKNGLYFAPVLLTAGMGALLFFHHPDETPEISSEKNSNAAVTQLHKSSGQSITTIPSNKLALSQKKSSVPDAMKNSARVSSEQKNKGSQQSTAEQEVSVTEEFFQAVGQYNNFELQEKLEDAFLGDSDPVVRDQVTAELTERLRKTADPAVTDRIVELLASNTLSDEQQGYLLRFLGKLGTRDAIDALTSLIPQLNEGQGKEQLVQVFSDLGNTQWDTDMFAKNPHPLEEAWKSASSDKLLNPAVASAI